MKSWEKMDELRRTGKKPGGWRSYEMEKLPVRGIS